MFGRIFECLVVVGIVVADRQAVGRDKVVLGMVVAADNEKGREVVVGRVAAVGRMVDMVEPAGRHYLKERSLEYKSLWEWVLGGQYCLT